MTKRTEWSGGLYSLCMAMMFTGCAEAPSSYLLGTDSGDQAAALAVQEVLDSERVALSFDDGVWNDDGVVVFKLPTEHGTIAVELAWEQDDHIADLVAEGATIALRPHLTEDYHGPFGDDGGLVLIERELAASHLVGKISRSICGSRRLVAKAVVEVDGAPEPVLLGLGWLPRESLATKHGALANGGVKIQKGCPLKQPCRDKKCTFFRLHEVQTGVFQQSATIHGNCKGVTTPKAKNCVCFPPKKKKGNK